MVILGDVGLIGRYVGLIGVCHIERVGLIPVFPLAQRGHIPHRHCAVLRTGEQQPALYKVYNNIELEYMYT
jgi:hypothetical protein